MDAADYCPMAREYSIWNATIASLQFWTADLDPVILGRAMELVYTTFFYSSSSHTLCQQSDEIIFGCFVITLNAAFDVFFLSCSILFILNAIQLQALSAILSTFDPAPVTP